MLYFTSKEPAETLLLVIVAFFCSAPNCSNDIFILSVRTGIFLVPVHRLIQRVFYWDVRVKNILYLNILITEQ